MSSRENPEVQARNLEYLQKRIQAFELNEKVERAAKRLAEFTSNMAKPQFEKSAKQTTQAFNAMGKASPKMWVFEKFLQILEPVFNLLDIINPLLEVMSAILEQALIPVYQELNPLIIMASRYLLENKDSIIQWIQVLTPLISIVMILSGRGNELTATFTIVGTTMDGLVVIINTVNTTITTIITTIDNLNSFFGSMYNKINNLINKIIEFLPWLQDIIDLLKRGSGGGGGGGGDGGYENPIYEFLGMQSGGKVKAHPPHGTLIRAGEKGDEYIVRGDQMQNVEYLLEENLAVNRELLHIKKSNQRSIY